MQGLTRKNQSSLLCSLELQFHRYIYVWKLVYPHRTEQTQERSSLGSTGPCWIGSSGSQRRVCLLRCLESVQVVDMQGDGAAHSLPALELIKLQTQLAGCPLPPLLPLPCTAELWHRHSYRLNTTIHTSSVQPRELHSLIQNIVFLY